MRVKIFYEETFELEEIVNKWLSENDVEIFRIFHNTYSDGEIVSIWYRKAE